MGLCSMDHTITHELGEAGVVAMLKLASPATAEMTTGRSDMMRAMLQPAIRQQHIARRCARHMLPICGQPIATRRDARDQNRLGHRQLAIAAEIWSARSPAVNGGLTSRAASP